MSSFATNQHCVEKLIQLSETQSVVATEDIFDEQGFKLLAKGASISREMQDRLLLRKLRAPLESSLSVHDGVTLTGLLQGTLTLIDSNPVLGKIAGSQEARAVLRDNLSLRLPPPLLLLLTCLTQSDPDSIHHLQLVTAISAGIAAQQKSSASTAQTALLAAVLHDLGEIYIKPDYVHSQRPLTPEEWKHVAAHPQIGQLVIRSLTSMPDAVLACVGQHHERHDGSGYPAQLDQHEQHPLSAWIAVADAVSALIKSNQTDGERISLALRIIPGEFDRQLTDPIIRAVQSLRADNSQQISPQSIDHAQNLLERLHAASAELQQVLTQPLAAPLQAICDKTRHLLAGFARSLRATGILDARVLAPEDFNDQRLLAEMQQIVREVSWRMRHLARNLYLRASTDPAALQRLGQAIQLLDQPPESSATAAASTAVSTPA
jgi:HD-GYP domain-containing protein (c-di-GMP phosphodiesterase class II)